MAKLDCGHRSQPDGFTTGYGQDPETNATRCYDCCANIERTSMIDTGKATLYLVGERGQEEVTDWPGRLRFNVTYGKNGRHNIARTRRDVWFRGPEGLIWWGVQYGEWTQIVHCRRVKDGSRQYLGA